MSIVRNSKFRHVFGKTFKEKVYNNIKVSKNSADSNMCDVNPQYIAMCIDGTGGGSFLVLPLNQTGRLPLDQPVVNGHSGDVIDLAWSPFNDSLIASCSDDTTVKVWEIPEGGLKRTFTHDDAYAVLKRHDKRVTIVMWHPTANDVLLSAGNDGRIVVWDVPSQAPIHEMNFSGSDSPQSISWNEEGSLLAVTTKSKCLRVIDIRAEKVLAEKKNFVGSVKASKCVFVSQGKYIFTTGFSKMSSRMYALWKADTLENMVEAEVDSANGILYPFYDSSTGVVFIVGKGDSNIRYYEINDEDPYVHYLSTFMGKESQRGVARMAKRGVDVHSCEIARFYRLIQTTGSCEMVSLIVPRKSEVFQDDIYPDFPSYDPVMTAEEWNGGKTCAPKTEKWKPIFDQTAGQGGNANATAASKPTRTLSKLSARPKQYQTAPENGTSLPPGINIEELLEDIKKLKATVRKQNRRITKLEKSVGDVVADDDGECEEE